ncbi:MAG: phosphonopyruvate decarboxylase [Deltaproteobacteria bacterium]|nr:phosphonopyruvate decarboxylase [Deltaproteobacteria bacterium]
MIQAQDFIAVCKERGITFFSGVPCSFLKPLINYVIQAEESDYIAASSEGEAVGISSGAALAGRKAAVLCQNSGLGNAVNPLTSLNAPFRIPVLLIVTLRGEPGLDDEPQHELMGEITSRLLDTLRIPWAFFPAEPQAIASILDRADTYMSEKKLPFALIIKKGALGKTEFAPHDTPCRQLLAAGPEGEHGSEHDRMRRMDVIRILRQTIPPQYAVIATTGKIGRELFAVGDSANQLYMVGSMGCASSLGFGVQQALPQQPVMILDGDGAALMKMGTLATIGHYTQECFIHVILDNEVYDSTGGQRTTSETVDFCRIASSCGYLRTFRTATERDLIAALNAAVTVCGPSLIHVKVLCGSDAELGRPTVAPYDVKERFMQFLQEGSRHG